MRRFLPLLALLGCSDPKSPTVCGGGLAQVTVEVGQTTTIEPCFEDPEGGTLTITVASQNLDIATASLRGTNVVVQAKAPGITTVTITATDPDNLTASQDLPVLVPNRPPTGSVDDLTLPTGVDPTIDLSSHFSDPDQQELTYTASSSGTSFVSVALSGSLLTLTTLVEGQATISVKASDGEGSVTEMFDVTVVSALLSDNFNAAATLDDWVIGDSARAEISDSYIALTGLSGFIGDATQVFGGEARDWTVDVGLRVTDEDAIAGFWIETGHERYSLNVFAIGDAQFGTLPAANWLFAWWDEVDTAFYVNPNWSMGVSDLVKESSDMNVSLSVTERGNLSVTVNGEALFSHGAEDFVLNTAIGMALLAWPEPEVTDPAMSSMNWVGFTAEEFTEQKSPPRAYQRPDFAKLKFKPVPRK